jgi:exodeoxyribonuclease VII large subunit
MQRMLAEANQGLDSFSRRLLSPSAQIAHQRLKLASTAAALTHALRSPINRHGLALAQLQQRWARHRPDVRAMRAQIASEQRHLTGSICNQVRQRREALAALAAQLELLNPQRTLERGYAIVRDAKGSILRSPGQIKVHEPLTMRLAEGSAEVGVESVQTLLE